MTPPADVRPAFAVVTDSACDISRELAAQHGIHVVPLNITIGSDTFDDGVISQAEFFRRMREAPVLPTTSQPSPGRLADAYAAALKAADEVIAIHLSSRLSGTFDVARMVAEQFVGKVHVFDSRNLSWGMGWQVIGAARASRVGSSAAEALELLDRVRGQAKIAVSIDSLENLRRSGRIGAVSSMIGSLLRLKITIVVDDSGAFVPLGRHRGNKAAQNKLLDWVGHQMAGATGGRFAVGHALAPERAQMLAEALGQRFDVTELVMYEAGAAISAHAGRIWGVAFLPDA